jgi:hypothetical protein
VAFVGLGMLFAAGYIVEDPGGWSAAGTLAVMVVPLALLTVAAVRRPAHAARLVVAGLAALAAYAGLGLLVDLVEGPVLPLATLVLALPVAVLGQRQAQRAGELLLVLAAVPFVAVLVELVAGGGDGPGLGAGLGSSSGVVVIPLALFGMLFLLAGASERREIRSGPTPAPQQRQPAAQQH